MSIQLAELHYLSAPVYDAGTIAERAESLIQSGIETPEPKEGSDTLLFFHRRYSQKFDVGDVPAQTAILSTDKPTEPEKYLDTIQQSWACEDAGERIQASQASRVVSEMMCRSLEPADRLKLFHGMLQAFVELTNPHAIVFSHSQQIIAPEAYLAACDKPPIHRPGSLNVRFFRITNAGDDDMIMDTRGLEEIGLHDLQCHFRELDPNQVSRVLYNTAVYIAENGAVIEAGHTIAGTQPDSKWECQFEDSMLDPNRVILDLNPGPPFAAGNR